MEIRTYMKRNMKPISFLLFVLAAFLLATPAQGTSDAKNYYIDAKAGSDQNNGLSPNKAWRTLQNVNQLKLSAGDQLLLKRGSVFNEILKISAEGKTGAEIRIDAYGEGKKPQINAPDSSLFAVLITNSSYLRIHNLEIVNTGTHAMARRTGIKVQNHNYGVSRNITLYALDIRDVNGSRVKSEGGGSGILIEVRGSEKPSKFDHLTIMHCTIKRCERNGMIWSANWDRSKWFPSTNVIVRYNSIEEVPGDGIVPIGCDGAVIEYNRMYNSPATLPDTEAAAGIWPWSCDNTLIQFNEVSDHKAPWDAQGFDSDFNCTNTVIRYNYSHDNEGGFILICNSGEADPQKNVGNIGTKVMYNISLNDGIRTRKTRVGIFSPTIHIAGPAEETLVAYNILLAGKKPAGEVDKSMITSDSWGGFAKNTTFKNNLFITPEESAFRLNESTNNNFTSNIYFGNFTALPYDATGKTPATDEKKYQQYRRGVAELLSTKEIADGKDKVTFVNPERIASFLDITTKDKPVEF